MSQDETFRKLSQRPFDEMVNLYQTFLSLTPGVVPSLSSKESFLVKYGWTADKFQAACLASRSESVIVHLERLSVYLKYLNEGAKAGIHK